MNRAVRLNIAAAGKLFGYPLELRKLWQPAPIFCKVQLEYLHYGGWFEGVPDFLLLFDSDSYVHSLAGFIFGGEYGCRDL